MNLRCFKFAHICFQVNSLHKGEAVVFLRKCFRKSSSHKKIIRKSLVEAKSCFNEQQTRQRDNFIRTVNWKCRKVTKSSLTAEKIFKERNQLKEKFGSLHIPSQWTKQWLDVFSMVMHFIFSVVVTIYSRACVRIRNDFDWWRCTRDIQKLHWMETLCEFAKLL